MYIWSPHTQKDFQIAIDKQFVCSLIFSTLHINVGINVPISAVSGVKIAQCYVQIALKVHLAIFITYCRWP